MRLKHVLALGLTLVTLSSSLGACGNSEHNSAEGADTNPTEADVEGTKAQTGAAQSGAKTDENEEMAEIVVVYPAMSGVPTGLEAVEAAINEITEEEINVHVRLNMLEVGSYDQQVNLMITSNETVDLMVNMVWGSTVYNTMLSQNQLSDITEAVNEYAPAITATMGDLLGATSNNGKVYAVPAYKNFASGIYIEMRTDVLEDLGLLEKAQNMKSFTEYEEILEAVKNSEKWGDLVPIVAMQGGTVLQGCGRYAFADKFEDTTFVDNLGDSLACVGVKSDDDSTKVFNVFASDVYRHNYEIVRAWNKKGYIYSDAATTTETGNDLIKSGIGFSMINTMGVGAEAAASLVTGRDMTCVLVASAPVTATSCTSFTWSVPVTAKEPEAAMAFLNMMFEDSRIANLFAWGIEGVDYTVDEAGIAHYIEGNETPAYHSVSWLNANEFTVTPWEGETLENWRGQEDYMKAAPVSDYIAFSVDTSAITNEISAINTVIQEYTSQITCGLADESDFDAFLNKLESSGIDRVVEFYQEQLDLWIANH